MLAHEVDIGLIVQGKMSGPMSQDALPGPVPLSFRPPANAANAARLSRYRAGNDGAARNENGRGGNRGRFTTDFMFIRQP